MTILNTLIEISIYAIIIFIVLVLFKRICKNKLSPAFHFGLWALLILRLMLPFTVESGFRLIQFSEPEIQWSEVQKTEIEAAGNGQEALRAKNNQPELSSDKNITMQGKNPTVAQEFSPPAKKILKVLTIQDIVLLVWLAGALAVITYFIMSYKRLKRNIKVNFVFPPAMLKLLLAECREELGIRKNIKIICQKEMSGPALLFPSTILMPSEMVATMEEEQVKMAIRHELMHVKRKDSLVCILMMALLAVYWFNPIVWIAYKMIREDMETACDAMVVKHLGAKQRYDYAETLLSIFSKQRKPQLLLGMALGNGKKTAEKRIRGIFMKQKSKKTVKSFALVLTAVLLIGCFTTACKPTPKSDTVIGKGQEYLKEYENKKEVKNDLNSIPEKWEASFDIAKGTVDIDAQIVLPDAENFPIIKVKPDEIMNEDVERFTQYFMKGKTLYEANPDEIKTKEEIQREILEIQRSINDPNSDFNELRESNGEESYQAALAEKQGNIDRLKEEYKTAPEVVNLKESNGHFKDKSEVKQYTEADYWISEDGQTKHSPPQAYNDDRRVTIQADLGGETPAFLSAYKYESLRFSYIRFENFSEFSPKDGIVEGKNKSAKLSLSYEQAESMANDAMQKLGFDEFMLDTGGIQTWIYPYRPEKEFYAFYYTRCANGVPVTYTNNAFFETGTQTLEHFEFWEPEYIKICIGDSGFVEFSWESPTQVIETVTDNAQLLPFDEIQRIFERQIKITGAWNNSPGLLNRNLKISTVKLGMCRIALKDNPNEYIVVPVWDFFGESHEKYPDEEFTEDIYRHSYLTINAIDGSIIDRSIGY